MGKSHQGKLTLDSEIIGGKPLSKAKYKERQKELITSLIALDVYKCPIDFTFWENPTVENLFFSLGFKEDQ